MSAEKIDISIIQGDLKTFESRVSINDGVLERLNDKYLNKVMPIRDIIYELANEQAADLSESELLVYKGVKQQIGGTPEQEMLYAAELDIADRIYDDFRGMSGVQNIVGYIAFSKAEQIAQKNGDELTQTQYDKIHEYIENEGKDDVLSIQEIENFVEKTCKKQTRRQK